MKEDSVYPKYPEMGRKRNRPCVWINGLFTQLYRKGIDYDLWWILRAYYKNFEGTVRINDASSCQDGSKLSKGYIRVGCYHPSCIKCSSVESLFEMLESEGVQFLMYGKIPCQDMAYADDVALVSIGPTNLQLNMNVTYI